SDVADFDGYAVGRAEAEPAKLVVLQAIARTFDFNHAVAPLVRPELDEIGQPGAIHAEVCEQPLEKRTQMGGGNARQCERKQLRAQVSPRDHGRLHAVLALEVREDGVSVSPRRELREAGSDVRGAACTEFGIEQIERRRLERVEEGTGNGRKDRVPEQQSEE